MIEYLKYIKKFSYWIIPILAWFIVGILGNIPLSTENETVITGLCIIGMIIAGILTFLAIRFTLDSKDLK